LRFGYTIHPIYTFGENDAFPNHVPSWVSKEIRWSFAKVWKSTRHVSGSFYRYVAGSVAKEERYPLPLFRVAQGCE
jgi:hypothetical protein